MKRNISGTLKAAADSNFDQEVDGMSGMGFRIVPPTGGTVQFLASFDGENFHAIKFTEVIGEEEVTEVTEAGDYKGLVSGYKKIRFKTSSGGSANGSVKGQASETFFFSKKLTPSGGVIAKLLNVNLKTIAENIIPYVGSYNGSNTVARDFAMKLISGTYAVKTIDEVLSTSTITFDELNFPSDLGLIYSIRIYIGAIDEFQVFINNIANGFNTNDEYMQFVKGKYEDYGLTANIVGNQMTITDGVGNGARFNDLIPSVLSRDENANVFTNSLSDAPAFSGGVDYAQTNINIKKGSETLLDGMGNTFSSIIPGLSSGNIISSPIRPVVLPKDDLFSAPVLTGTQDDCIVDILVLGDSI